MCACLISQVGVEARDDILNQKRPLSQMSPSEWKRFCERRKTSLPSENRGARADLCRSVLTRRKSSLPDITAIVEEGFWYSKPSCKRYSLQRSQSVEWDPVSATFTAITEDDTKELERILTEYEIDLNFLNSAGVSPLHTAALVGNLEAVKLLLDFGAEVDYLDQNEQTTLEMALLAGSFDCASLLIKAGASMRNVVDGIKMY